MIVEHDFFDVFLSSIRATLSVQIIELEGTCSEFCVNSYTLDSQLQLNFLSPRMGIVFF